jgi:hypothetical protein
MFIGSCLNEFPISTSEEMTQTYNGDDIEYVIYIDQGISREVFIEQQKPIDVYIKQDEDYPVFINQQQIYDIYVDQQIQLTLEN